MIMQDGGVDAAGVARPANVGIGADVIVAWRLCGGEDEGISLGGKDLDGIDGEGFVVDAVDFNDGLFLEVVVSMVWVRRADGAGLAMLCPSMEKM